ncbi:MAG: hypothetical protein HY342_00750 [Candidatus Lambdaproteobacteria bacterium]|nr:hypothetical protein [Candidatus Lambdaproteobacteria bacterium]
MTTKFQVLLSLRDVVLQDAGGARTEPFSLDIHEAERLHMQCARDGWRDRLVQVVSGQTKPAQGSLLEVVPVLVQSDANLRATLDLNRSLADYLHSEDAPEFVWLEQRRRSLQVLVDLLGIAPADTRRPLKLQSAQTVTRYWVLRFLLSRAQLLIGSEIFRLDDAQIRAAMARRWPDLPGAVLVCAPREALPGPVDTTLHLDADGTARIERQDAAPSTAEA